MKKLSKFVLSLLAVSTLAFAQNAAADQIDGAITFSGGAVFDTSSLASATRVDSFSNVKVSSRDGDFASFVTVGDSVAMATPYIFSPSTPTPGLWSVGGFTFDLTSSTVVFQDASFLGIIGTGTISGNGFDPTPGTWTFSSQSPSAGGVFSFSSGSASRVPETGTTLILLLGGLAAVEAVRRKVLSA